MSRFVLAEEVKMGGGRSRRSSSSSDSDYGAPIRITKTQTQVLPSVRSHSGRHRHHSPDTVVVNANSFLQLPGQPKRTRASSTSGQPAPVINNYLIDDRDRSRSRSRHRSRHDSSSSSEYHRSRSRRRHSEIPTNVLVDLELAERERRDREHEKDLKRALRDAKIRDEEDEREREKDIKRALREAKQKADDEKEERERIIREARLKEAEDKKKAEDKEKEIVAAWQQKEREKKEKEEKEKKEFDEKYEQRVKMEFLAAGYSEEEIENIIKKKKDKAHANRQELERQRPTYIRIHTDYISVLTLQHYGLPWDYDRDNPDYIIIRRYVSHELQQELFEHTRRIQNRKLIEAPKPRRKSGIGEILLGAEGSNMYVVKKKNRSKSPARGYFIRDK